MALSSENLSVGKVPSALLVDELAEHLQGTTEVRILDVRTPGEFESAHIQGAYNIPLDMLSKRCHELGGVVDSLVLVCQSGRRAAQAEAILKKIGVDKLLLLDGGMKDWIEADHPIVEGKTRLSLERQVRILAGALAAIGGALAILADPWFGLIPTIIGSGLVFAGVTDTCGMAILLGKLPYNRSTVFNSEEMVRALKSRSPSPAAQSRGS